MDIKKEIIDQSLHFGLGFLFVILVLFYPIAIVPLIILFAIYREYMQHSQLVWFNMDLVFWYLGIFFAVVLKYFLGN